jgi:kinesin family protein 15
MPVDKVSTRIPLPPLQTQDLPGEGGDAGKFRNDELNLKITPLSVTTQHVYVDCTDGLYAESEVGVKRASTSSSNDVSACSSIDLPISLATGVEMEAGDGVDSVDSVDGLEVETSLTGQSGGALSSASGKSMSACLLSALNVVVRVRPVGADEAGSSSVVSTLNQGDVHQVVLSDPSRDASGPFTVQVDAALPSSSTQADVFGVVGWPMVDHCMDGFNSTIFAYGQTGSGKTHTMMGDIEDEQQAGLIPRVFARLFETIRAKARDGEDDTYTISCSFLEIYNEEVIDLLNTSSTNLQIRDGDVKRGVYVQGLSTHPVASLGDVLRLIAIGSENRKIASTELNERSSRSHSVFTATITWEGVRVGVKTVRSSKLNLVDLAGSERVGKSGATGEQLVEARSINKSLSVLGRVIARLVDKQGSGGHVHVPYRDSKLTFLLQVRFAASAGRSSAESCRYPDVYSPCFTVFLILVV